MVVDSLTIVILSSYDFNWLIVEFKSITDGDSDFDLFFCIYNVIYSHRLSLYIAFTALHYILINV
jgi:hypothetical protein